MPSELPFGCVICGANLVVLSYGLKLATTCVSCGASWRSYGVGQGQPLPVSGTAPPGRSYKVICVSGCQCWVWRYLGGAYAVNYGQLQLLPDWGHLVRGKEHDDVSHCLFGVCRPLRNIREVCCMDCQPPVWLRKRFGQRFELGVVGSQYHQGGSRVLLIENQICFLPVSAGCVEEELNKE